MRIAFQLMMVCSLLVLPACASRPSDKDIAAADFGNPPANYRAVIDRDIRSKLIDPYSADIKIGGPYRAALSKVSRLKGLSGWDFGYAVDALVNAKNRLGGYVGYRRKSYFFMPDGWISPFPGDIVPIDE